MSSGSIGSSKEPRDLARAIELLQEAQSIIDGFNRPEIGARLQDVIELLNALDSPEE